MFERSTVMMMVFLFVSSWVAGSLSRSRYKLRTKRTWEIEKIISFSLLDLIPLSCHEMKSSANYSCPAHVHGSCIDSRQKRRSFLHDSALLLTFSFFLTFSTSFAQSLRKVHDLLFSFNQLLASFDTFLWFRKSFFLFPLPLLFFFFLVFYSFFSKFLSFILSLFRGVF